MTSIESPAVGRVEAPNVVRRLARLAAHLTADERNDDPLILALRLAIDQLFRRDSAERRKHLLLAADVLAVLRGREPLAADDVALLDIVQAASLASAGESERARKLIGERKLVLDSETLRSALEAVENELAV